MPFMENTGVPCTGTFFTLVYWTVPGETYFSLLYYSLPTIHFQMPFPVQNYHSSIVSLSLPRYVLKFAGGRQDVREPDAPGIRPSWKYLGNLWRKTSKIPEPTPVLFLMRRTEVAWASHRSISKWDGLLNKRENRWGYHACIAATETYMLFSTGHGSTFLPPYSTRSLLTCSDLSLNSLQSQMISLSAVSPTGKRLIAIFLCVRLPPLLNLLLATCCGFRPK